MRQNGLWKSDERCCKNPLEKYSAASSIEFLSPKEMRMDNGTLMPRDTASAGGGRGSLIGLHEAPPTPGSAADFPSSTAFGTRIIYQIGPF